MILQFLVCDPNVVPLTLGRRSAFPFTLGQLAPRLGLPFAIDLLLLAHDSPNGCRQTDKQPVGWIGSREAEGIAEGIHPSTCG